MAAKLPHSTTEQTNRADSQNSCLFRPASTHVPRHSASGSANRTVDTPLRPPTRTPLPRATITGYKCQPSPPISVAACRELLVALRKWPLHSLRSPNRPPRLAMAAPRRSPRCTAGQEQVRAVSASSGGGCCSRRTYTDPATGATTLNTASICFCSSFSLTGLFIYRLLRLSLAQKEVR